MCGDAGLLRKEKWNYSSLEIIKSGDTVISFKKQMLKFNIVPLSKILHLLPKVRSISPSNFP